MCLWTGWEGGKVSCYREGKGGKVYKVRKLPGEWLPSE